MLLQRQVSSSLDNAVDLTPMVDVVFQLLIFLMLTYQSSPDSEVELPPAEHGTGVEETHATTLTLVPPEEPGGPIAVHEGIDVGPESLLEGPEAIERVVRAGLDRGRRRVVLQAGGDVPHGEVLRVGGIVSEVEGVGLHLGVKDPEE